MLQQAHSAEQGREWLLDAGLPEDRAVVDLDGRIAGALGIDVIPSVVLYDEGEPFIAQTIPSFRQLVPLLSKRTMPSLPTSTKGPGRT